MSDGAASTGTPGKDDYQAPLCDLTALDAVPVPAGLVKIEHVNFGEDPHDLRLRRIGGTHTYVFAKIAAGGREVRTFRLRAGSYHVWCAVSG